jgi:hypothetical protein
LESSSGSIKAQFVHIGNDTKSAVILSPEMTDCMLRTPFSGAFPMPEEEEDEQDLDIQEYIDQTEPRIIGNERTEGDRGF